MEVFQIPDNGKKSVVGTPSNLGLILKYITILTEVIAEQRSEDGQPGYWKPPVSTFLLKLRRRKKWQEFEKERFTGMLQMVWEW